MNCNNTEIDAHYEIYNNLMNKIENNNESILIFDVPLIVHDIDGYHIKKCLLFLIKKFVIKREMLHIINQIDYEF